MACRAVLNCTVSLKPLTICASFSRALFLEALAGSRLRCWTLASRFQFGLTQVLLAAQLFEAFLFDLQYFGSPRAALAGFDAFRELLQGRAALGQETVALLGFPLQRLAVVLQALVPLPELLFLFLQLPLLLVQLRLERLQRLLLLERFLLLLAQLLGHAGEVGQGALHVL